jgi:hypothetical protein
MCRAQNLFTTPTTKSKKQAQNITQLHNKAILKTNQIFHLTTLLFLVIYIIKIEKILLSLPFTVAGAAPAKNMKCQKNSHIFEKMFDQGQHKQNITTKHH